MIKIKPERNDKSPVTVISNDKPKRGRPITGTALTPAQRQARFRAALKKARAKNG